MPGERKCVCRWCGCLKVPGWSHSGAGNNRGMTPYYCRNPDCPRRGQVPWVIPLLRLPHIRQLKTPGGDAGNGFDDVVRAIEDFSPLT